MPLGLLPFAKTALARRLHPRLHLRHTYVEETGIEGLR